MSQRDRSIRLEQAPAASGQWTSAPPTADIAPDCRHYRGDRPCLANRLCAGCGHYDPWSHRVCVIKLGALGDVIRTLCILPTLRDRHPSAHITWVSAASGCRMIANHPMIDRVLEFDAMSAMTLAAEQFDTVISLDKEPEPCALAMALRAETKLGIGLSEHGTPVPLNAQAQPYFQLGLSDELKFVHNTKSYPRLVHEALGFEYEGQRYELPVDEAQVQRVRMRLAARGWEARRPTLGINVGAGSRFANKMWPATKIAEVIALVRQDRPRTQVVLLGGPAERLTIERIGMALKKRNATAGVIDGGTDHDEPAFVALVDTCDVVFTGDTMALHVAVALGKQVAAFFGPTCQQEIDLYGRGEKLVARVSCGPCYKRVCDEADACIDRITAREAADAIGQLLTHACGDESAEPGAAWRRAG